MPQPSSSLSLAFGRKLQRIETSRSQLESLYTRGFLSNTTTTSLYEGLFLSVYVSFEAFLEDLFLGLVVVNRGVRSSRRDVVARIDVRSAHVARKLMVSKSKKYVDWLPYSNTIDLAQKYFRGGRPFTDLTQPERDVLHKSYLIRNAIAHGSDYSIKKFEETVLPQNVLQHERRPAGFLRGVFRANPRQSRFENYSAELLRISRKLAV